MKGTVKTITFNGFEFTSDEGILVESSSEMQTPIYSETTGERIGTQHKILIICNDDKTE